MPDGERTQQSVNHRKGERMERKILDKIGGSCAFSAIVSETSGGHSTPDIVCVQDSSKGLKDVTRLIESKYNGYVKKSQRDELVDIARRSPDKGVRIEVWRKKSPRKEKKKTIYNERLSHEDTRRILEEEFSTVRFDKKEWKKRNS